MHTNNRTVLSRALGLGLATFTAASAFVLGPAAPVTLNSFYCLSIYGVIQIAILSYSPGPRLRRRVSAAPASTVADPKPVARTIASTHRPARRSETAPVGVVAVSH